MDAAEIRTYVDEALERQRGAIRLQTGIAAAVILIGLLIVAAVHLTGNAGTDSTKWLITIGGGFISTLSSFPVQQIIAGRDRTAALGLMKRTLASVDPNQPMDSAMEQRFWKLFDKALGV